uniref:Uncharacterized protein n=1 Tax=Anguilla anguilla TaxID=7936 RepID=A0A0E9Q7K5_ANGAN
MHITFWIFCQEYLITYLKPEALIGSTSKMRFFHLNDKGVLESSTVF